MSDGAYSTGATLDERIARLLSEGPSATPFVDLPGGVFEMGSHGRPDELPLRTVRVRPFSVALAPVTNVEFAAFLAATDHEPPRYWDDPHFRRPDCPVIGVSWLDAVDYCAWLSEVLGRACRLPTEAEREYVTRAGTTTPFWWGATITPTQANYSTSTSVAGASAAMSRGTVSVGSYPPNAFGLHDVHGNVFEWTEDCMKYDYNGAPADGSAWMSGDCGQRVVRGGSWGGHPRQLRSAARASSNPTFRSVMGSDVGFRVARSD